MGAARQASAGVTRGSLALSILACAGLLATTPVLSASTDPLAPLTSAKGSMLCFQRIYSADHLARHPRQTIRSVLLAYQEQGLVTIVLSPRAGSPKRISAGCGWRQGAGIDTSDRKMIPNFNKPAGLDCIVTVGDTAEEGGYLLIDPAPDATSMTLYLQSPITTDDHAPGKGRAYNLTLDSEDRTFALTRIDAGPCTLFKAATE